MTRAKTSTALAPLLFPQPEETPALKSWALVELFGHQRIVGHVTVDPPDFPGMVRVDVPALKKDDKIIREAFTRYFGPKALYSVSPVQEKDIPMLLAQIDGRPVQPVSFSNYRDREDF
jgi:hypothetical protein